MGLFTYEDNRFLRNISKLIVLFITVLSFSWFLVYALFGQTIISGQSMSPILNAEDVCLVDKLSHITRNYSRFDVILFERNDTAKLNTKRVIGLPGETVQIVDGEIYIDGELLNNDKIGTIALPGLAENPIELSGDEYFVLGDNTESSEDSRFANIGNVSKNNIYGKVWLKVRPLAELSLIK